MAKPQIAAFGHRITTIYTTLAKAYSEHRQTLLTGLHTSWQLLLLTWSWIVSLWNLMTCSSSLQRANICLCSSTSSPVAEHQTSSVQSDIKLQIMTTQNIGSVTRKLIVLLLHDYRCRDLWSAVWSHGNNQMLRETQTSWQLPGSRGVGPSPVPSSGWAEHGCCMISRSSCTILETVGTDQPPHRLETGTIKQNCLQLNTSHCSNSTITFPALK